MRTVGIRHECIEPHNACGEFRVDIIGSGISVEVERTVEISRSNIYAVATWSKR